MKAICFPSGDQSGCPPCVSRLFPLPSALTTNSSLTCRNLSPGVFGLGR
jgi:hypothetical protein